MIESTCESTAGSKSEHTLTSGYCSTVTYLSTSTCTGIIDSPTCRQRIVAETSPILFRIKIPDRTVFTKVTE